ncbi:MAG TPA: VOC family protein [Candidatus Kapabacteria bacterium]
MPLLNPYLNFPGNTEEAFNFYKSIFGGDFVTLQRFKDIPGGNFPAEVQNGIMHVSLKIGNNTLMGTDAIESMGHAIKTGNYASLSIEADSKEQADHIFNGLSAGGSDIMAMKDQFWGAYWGALKDQYGIPWMVNYTYPKK